MTRYCKRTAYLVQDYGGIFGARWTDDVRVFASKDMAVECARAHGERMGRRYDRSMYLGTKVYEIELIEEVERDAD